MLDKYIQWIEAHERLLLVAVAGCVLWFGIGKIDTLIANHDHANLQQAEVVAAVQQEKNEALAKQVAQQAAEYKALADKVNAQNAALEQANVNLANALIRQQQTVAVMTPPELVARWNVLVPKAAVSISNGQVLLSEVGAVATVQQLEEVPVLRTQIENDRTQIENSGTLLTASQGQVATLSTQVTGLKLQAVDDAKVCSAQIAVVKADARKSKRTWFLIGYVAGFLSRQYIKTATGF